MGRRVDGGRTRHAGETVATESTGEVEAAADTNEWTSGRIEGGGGWRKERLAARGAMEYDEGGVA